MIQERPLCYENTGNDDSLCGRENLTSSVNILSHTASSRDPPAHEDGRALALIKYLIWICFVSLIVLALWIVFYWKQSPNVLDDSTNKDWFNGVWIIFIGVVYGLCSAFCTFFDSTIPGNSAPSSFNHMKSRRNLAVIGSTDHYSDPSPPLHNITNEMPPFQTVTTPIHRSGSIRIEYLTLPFNTVFVIIAMLLWLQNKMGVTVF